MEKGLIKIKSWEFWPIWVIYLPVFFAWLYYAFRLKSFFFFTNVNPKIEMSGFAGESKMGILNQIPNTYKPKDMFVFVNNSLQDVWNKIEEKQIKFPLVAKPDIGERGLSVQVCENVAALKRYQQKASFNFVIQEFIDFPVELAVLYYRKSGEKTGTISSLCQKEFLSVTGNGKDTIRILMQKNIRARLQIKRFEKEKPALLKKILSEKETYTLEPIGNHNKGTTFLDKNHLIDSELTTAFDVLSKQIPELHFGRYDLKCKSIKDLKQLKNFSIMEINGVSAEPAHIYQPGYSFWKAEKALLAQWKVLFEISKVQSFKGIKPMSFKSAISHLKQYKRQISLHKQF